MASHTFPIDSPLSRGILRIRTRPRETGSIRFVLGFDRLRLFLHCPRHAWTWPRTNHDEHVSGFDAHQTCFKCNSRRFFDSQHWLSGPVYRPSRNL